MIEKSVRTFLALRGRQFAALTESTPGIVSIAGRTLSRKTVTSSGFEYLDGGKETLVSRRFLLSNPGFMS
jgi:hypothetical protein